MDEPLDWLVLDVIPRLNVHDLWWFCFFGWCCLICFDGWIAFEFLGDVFMYRLLLWLHINWRVQFQRTQSFGNRYIVNVHQLWHGLDDCYQVFSALVVLVDELPSVIGWAR